MLTSTTARAVQVSQADRTLFRRLDILSANDSLRARLTRLPAQSSKPVASRPGQIGAKRTTRTPLPAAVARELDDLIRDFPNDSHGAIVARLAIATGVRVARTTVQRRRPPRPAQAHAKPLTAEQAEILADLLEAHPEATRTEQARRFQAMTGRRINPRTVSVHALDAQDQNGARRPPGAGSGRRRYRSAADWPSWTDQVRLDIPWSEVDVIGLGLMPSDGKAGAQ